MIQDFFQQLRDSFSGLPLKSKVSITLMFIAGLAAFILVLVWLNQPDYRVLYSDISPEDAGRVVDYLQSNNIKYKYEHGGTSIMVPSGQVYDVRMQLANEGIPNDGVIGYEIFDDNNFGMTEYVQQVNYKRAMEGELQRTIQQMTEVRAARVHLVMPEEALFEEDQSSPTAAVILKLKPNHQLEKRQVEGIQYLVANSVDKLETHAVSILDAAGNLLTDDVSDPRNGSQTSTQHNAREKLEDYLTQKAQSMLDGVLGYGKSIVRVTAELDFQQVNKTEEIYDPDSQVIRSEERIQNAQTTPDTASNQQEHLITNYEMNRTIQTITEHVGDLRRLNVAVMIDGTYNQVEGEESEPVYQPRDAQELQRLERIVKAAVGFNSQRGDQFEISNIQFDMSDYKEQEKEFADMQKRQFWSNILNKSLSVGLVIVFLIFLRNVIKRSKVLIGEMPFQGNGRGGRQGRQGHVSPKTGDLPGYDIEMEDEVLERHQLQSAIQKYSDENTKEVTSLIRSWLVED